MTTPTAADKVTALSAKNKNADSAVSTSNPFAYTCSRTDPHDRIKELEEKFNTGFSVYNRLRINSEKIITKLTTENKRLSASEKELTEKLRTTEKERIRLFGVNNLLMERRGALYTKIKELEDLLAKRDQTDQTIFLNQPKDTRFYNAKEGLGLTNPQNLKKVNCRQLYDVRYMKIGLTKLMAFTGTEETNALEDEKRKTKAGVEVPFDYTELNKSYKTKEPPLTPADEVITYAPEKETVQDGEEPSTLEPVVKPAYIPPLVRKFAELKESFDKEKQVFELERDQLLKEISMLKTSSQSITVSQPSSHSSSEKCLENSTNSSKTSSTHSEPPSQTGNHVKKRVEKRGEWIEEKLRRRKKEEESHLGNKNQRSSALFYVKNKSRSGISELSTSSTRSGVPRNFLSEPSTSNAKRVAPKCSSSKTSFKNCYSSTCSLNCVKSMKVCCFDSDSFSNKDKNVNVQRCPKKSTSVKVNVEGEYKLPCLKYPLKVHSLKHLKRLSQETILKDHLSEHSLTVNEISLAPKFKQQWVPKAEAEKLRTPNTSQSAGLGSQIKQKLKHFFDIDKEGPTWRWVPKCT
ncbi:unnamed protein product [Cuscuta epithymum]|uniref:Uncharacterized protein n=1 Tax=Cuscuta epithymum TaxID=186058 RepID=A0AAV0G8S9_9ASTE|nr:unnamed protein product [Cuscuta epithymum]